MPVAVADDEAIDADEVDVDVDGTGTGRGDFIFRVVLELVSGKCGVSHEVLGRSIVNCGA